MEDGNSARKGVLWVCIKSIWWCVFLLYYPTMHHKRHTALVGAMTELDVKGMPFSDAKKQLLEAGYTEAEIRQESKCTKTT